MDMGGGTVGDFISALETNRCMICALHFKRPASIRFLWAAGSDRIRRFLGHFGALDQCEVDVFMNEALAGNLKAYPIDREYL